MSRLSELFAKLERERKVEDDGTPAGITYLAISEALRRHKVSETDVLRDLRDIVFAEIATGVSAYQGLCGPEIQSATLNVHEGRQLVALLNGILDLQEKLRKEQKECPCPTEPKPAESEPGSPSTDTPSAPK